MEIKVADFNLHHCLTSGQCFEWSPFKEGFAGVIFNTFFYLYQNGNTLHFQAKRNGVDLSEKEAIMILTHYFSLDAPYTKIVKAIRKDIYISQAIDRYYGLRVIKQEHFPCIIAFLLSGNNSVTNVQSVYRRLSETYGKLVYQESGKKFYAFPDFETLHSLEKKDFEACKSGYRAAYIVYALNTLSPKIIDSLDTHSYVKAKEILMQVHGIGPKIADCILLYSYKFQNIYPTDTWVKKFTKEIYFQEKHASEETLRNFGTTYFKPYAGWAQLFLYIFYREGNSFHCT